MITSQNHITEHEMKVATLNVAEEGAREYAGQSASGNAHIDIHALGCMQGSTKFVHEAFRKPLTVFTTVHIASTESPGTVSGAKTKTFIH